MTPRLPRSWESLPALATLMDADGLTELFGTELGGRLRTSHLRYKPGVSAVARVDVEPTGAVHWVAAYAASGDGRDKLDRILARTGRDTAHGRGARVLVAGVPGRPGARLAVGRIGVDPDLRRPLAALGPERARDVGQPGDGARLLRYNPRRRVVLTDVDGTGARWVTKLTAGPAPADPALLARLAAAGLPVLAPAAVPGVPSSPHVLHYPWFGSGDLAALAADRSDTPDHRASLEAAATAGAALARLHVRGPSLTGPAKLGAPAVPDRKTASLAADLSALETGLAERCARVGRAAAAAVLHRPASSVLLHGDFSADQVLVDRSGAPGAPEIRLADFDRMRTGAAADDLGGFLAVELLEADAVEAPTGPEENALTGALLRGYGSEAGLPESSEVLAWAALHVLARSMEPFRSTGPDWTERTGRRLTLAERLVERAARAPGAVVPGPPSARSAPSSRPRAGRVADPVPPAPVRVPETVPEADGSPLRVRRAWPAADARLVLELEDCLGRVRAGEAVPGAGRRWSFRVLPYGEDPGCRASPPRSRGVAGWWCTVTAAGRWSGPRTAS